MKIIIIDFSNGVEPISSKPNRYGGVGPTYFKFLKDIKECFCCGGMNSFNLEEDSYIKEKVIFFNELILKKILDGEKFENIFPIFKNFDLILHSKTNFHINTNLKQIIWCPGQNEEIHPNNKHILLHNILGQKPSFKHNLHKIYPMVLGIDIPEFQEYKRENFLFQCSNHFPQIQSHIVAQFCLNNKIPCYFAGPISEGYNLLDYIDNKTTHYLGVIKEEEKIEYLKKAAAFTSFYSFPINETPLAIKQALSYGLPILCTPIGHLRESIIPPYNGYFINSEEDFVNSYHKCIDGEINSIDCWDFVQKYSVDNMIKTFLKAAQQVINENNP